MESKAQQFADNLRAVAHRITFTLTMPISISRDGPFKQTRFLAAALYLAAVGEVGALLGHVDNVVGPPHTGQTVRNGLLAGPCGLVHAVNEFPADNER